MADVSALVLAKTGQAVISEVAIAINKGIVRGLEDVMDGHRDFKLSCFGLQLLSSQQA
ncbi:MAG: hypothetical protein AAGB19_23060 [Cyanobacteria bacterium P01_F01_bin.3]